MAMNYQKVSGEQFANILTRPPPEILIYMLQVAEISRRDPNRAPVIAYNDIPKTKSTTLPREFGWLFCGRGHVSPYEMNSNEEAMAQLKKFVPFLDDLCFHGNYCLAGSCAVMACLQLRGETWSSGYRRAPQDADFYPYYDPTVQRDSNVTDEDLIRGGYGAFIEDMNDICGGRLESPNGKKLAAKHPYMRSTQTYRNRHCTTIALSGSHDETVLMQEAGIPYEDQFAVCKSYQIIHRAHTSPVSVVVGFDQICCKAFYDGDQIYFTLDAALALYFRINPIDWRRESPTHLRRAWKYYERYDFTPIFPGLSFDLGTELMKASYMSYYLPRARLVCEKVWNHSRGAGLNKQEVTNLHLEFEHFGTGEYINREDVGENVEWEEHVESDYNGEVTPRMALNYRCISAAIKNKPDQMLVFAHKPGDIIDKYHYIDIRAILEKLAVGRGSPFYMGTHRCRQVSVEMSRLALKYHGHVNCHVGFMNAEQMSQFIVLQQEQVEIFEARLIELDGMIQEQSAHLVKVEFLKSNPGAQFTASFHPIIRKNPRDYFGSRYQHVELTIYKRTKLFCLWLRKIGVLFVGGWDLNVMKLIFRWMDRLLITNMMKPLIRPADESAGTETDPLKIILGAPSQPFPWMDPKPIKQTQSVQLTAPRSSQPIS